MEISAAMVMALRGKTGLSMMECKKALVEAQGKEEVAIEILRKKGLAKASERADRTTGEGRVAVALDAGVKAVAMVVMGCETEPVSNLDEFVKLAEDAAHAAVKLPAPTVESVAAQAGPAGGASIGDRLQELFNKIREKMEIKRVGRFAGHVGHYLHHNKKVGVLAEFNMDCPADMKTDICMHIAAIKPKFLKREEVDAALVEKERAFARDEVKDKPANIIDKIVEGKINRWFGEIVMLEQPFVKDDKKTVQQAMNEVVKGLTVVRFERFDVVS